jgi:hypothetical protein
MKSTLIFMAVVLPFLAVAAFGAQAPKLALKSLTVLPLAEKAPFAAEADASKAVDAAFARAQKSGKRVLIDLGGNWCGDCIVLANIMRLPEMKPFLEQHFEMVSVDVGRFDKNLQIPARFGITKRLEGVPSVIIAEPDGRFVNKGRVSALADARHMTPQAIADWLAQWAK